ncbi:MAG: hypothetical protein E4H14_07290 [Candidatus Thorarchaeota archaeon]|nr:MAG: hypothetical protein E4H14_07290 [Candidatus Thorarchaeota archaeon]
MKRKFVLFVSFVIVVLFIGVDIKNAFDNPEMKDLGSDGELPITSGTDLVRKALAWSGPPKAPVSLKELVLELQSVTPIANRTDYDGDGLWDIIESVIGTDFNGTDSDFDNLNDTFEVFNDLDPLSADSNNDGLPDNYEVLDVLSLDIDNDGTPNAWDFDNDNDGISDEVDISPNAKSSVHDVFEIDVKTDGKPLYISFQLIPDNPQQSRLINQWWDWPSDSSDRMQDVDGSKKDVRVIPFLKLTTNLLLDQDELEGYPTTVTSYGMIVGLSPVYDFGNIVGLEARIYLPESVPMNLSLQIELQWRVVGYTDIVAKALAAASGMYISSYSDSAAVANVSDSNNIVSSCALQWVSLDNGRVALKRIGGGYLSVANNGVLFFNGTEIGPRESFTPVDLTSTETKLMSVFTGLYVSTSTNGILVANSTVPEILQITELGTCPEAITLEIYDDNFMLSGISIQESYSSNLGLYYSDNRNETLAAATLLTYDFLRNYTTTLWDIPNILSNREINLMYQDQSFVGLDQAYVSMSNGILPNALASLPIGAELPIIIATEDTLKIADLSEVIVDSYIGEDSLFFNLTSMNTTVVKSMICHYYNTTTYQALTTEEIMIRIENWGYDDATTRALMAIMFKFTTGESIINRVGLTGVEIETPEISLVDNSILFAKGIIGTIGDDVLNGVWASFKYVGKLIKSYKTARISGEVIETAQIARQVSTVSKAASSSAKVAKFFKSSFLAVLCIIIDVGLSIWAAVTIANEIGGTVGKEVGAIYGVVSSLVALFIGIGLLAMTFSSGGALAPLAILISIMLLVAELFGGLISKLVEKLTELIFGSPHQTAWTLPSSYISDISFDFSDDRLSVGEQISVLCSVIGNVTGYGDDQRYWVGRSSSTPWVSIDAPPGSNSETGYSGSPSEGGIFNSSDLAGIETTNYWETREYISSAWIEPGVAMPNFPVAIRINTDYEIWNVWYHRVLGIFKCPHEDMNSDSTSFEHTRFYFDVMPESLDAFANWRCITPLDSDRDGLNNTIEQASYVSSPWKYDSDGDGLNDAFEVNIGSDPRKYDSDGDSLTDYYEYIYGTNATNDDSDGDGLYDYLEIAGWQINFNYTGNSSLPFEILVTSNPCLNDSDGDGIGDLDEYYSNTNPRTSDTNGDGHCDEAHPLIESHIVLEGMRVLLNGSSLADRDFSSITTDDAGYIYISSKYSGIWKYYPNFTEVPLSPSSHFDDMDDSSTYSISVDNANDWIYASWSDGLYRYSLDGMVENPGSWTPVDDYFRGIDVSADSSIFATQVTEIQKYSSAGTLLATWGSYGSADDEFNSLREIDVDNTNGFLYVIDQMDSSICRIVRRSAIDGSYLGSIPKGTNVDMGKIAVDIDGYVYAIVRPESEAPPDYLCKFDRNGMEDKSFRFNITELVSNYLEVQGLCVDHQKNIYIVVRNDTSWPDECYTLFKFSQDIELVEPSLTDDNPDWDEDGLTNQQEVDGWEITVAFNATYTMTFNVTSDPRLGDTDGDHLCDYLEYNLTSNPQSPDSDADGASDHEEWLLGLDLTHWDGDGDLLGDGVELTYGSDHTLFDTDSDTLSDFQEFLLNSDPTKIDTDDDGATDAQEYAGNSSLLVADSDGDFVFDGAEYDTGTSPLNADVDGDGLVDGDEALFGTSPFTNDTDGDNVSDWLEIELWLDPLNNDTDNDGISDGTELEWGSNPWNGDSDWDGVPDGEDPDTFSSWVGPVVLAYDLDEYNNTLYFAQELQGYADVIIVSVEELLESYTEYQYIVLVGRPDVESDTVAGLTYSLLEDTGTVLEEMAEPESHEIATRYGYWTDPQTIVILSEAYSTDVYTVLQILRGRDISVLPDFICIDYHTEIISHSETYGYAFNVNEIDTLKSTDTIISIALGNLAIPSLVIQRYNANTTPHSLTTESGLAAGDVSLGRYWEITMTFSSGTSATIVAAFIQIYYRNSEIDLTGDGNVGQLGDVNESTINLYWFDEDSATWVRLTEDLDWVHSIGLNTTDVELYGESYAGCIWVQVSRLPFLALAGALIGIQTTFPDMIWLFMLVGCVGIIGTVIIYWSKKKTLHKRVGGKMLPHSTK